MEGSAMRGRIDHIILTVREPESSFALYDGFLRFLGYKLASRSEDGIEWLLDSGPGSPSVGLVKARGSGITKRHDRYSPGFHHLAWAADSREDVDRLHNLLAGREPTCLMLPPNTRNTTEAKDTMQSSSRTRTGLSS